MSTTLKNAHYHKEVLLIWEDVLSGKCLEDARKKT